MLSVQMIPPSRRHDPVELRIAEVGDVSRPRHARGEVAPRQWVGVVVAVNWRIWPASTAFWTRARALLKDASVTFAGSSPFSSMISPSVSPIEFQTPILPFSFGSSSSCLTEVTGPVTSSFQAMPSMPESQGSEYSRSGSNGGCSGRDEVRDVRDQALVELLRPSVLDVLGQEAVVVGRDDDVPPDALAAGKASLHLREVARRCR